MFCVWVLLLTMQAGTPKLMDYCEKWLWSCLSLPFWQAPIGTVCPPTPSLPTHFFLFVPFSIFLLFTAVEKLMHARSLAHTYTLIMLQSIVWTFFECRTMVSQGVMLCNVPETAKWVFQKSEQKWWEAGSRTGNVLYFDLPQLIIVFFFSFF